jgi:ATP/ADP translocase
VGIFLWEKSMKKRVCVQLRAGLAPGVDGWLISLQGLMGMVCLGGIIITAIYWLMQRTVVKDINASAPKKKKKKHSMGVGESFAFLARSSYIRDLALLVGGGRGAHVAVPCGFSVFLCNTRHWIGDAMCDHLWVIF